VSTSARLDKLGVATGARLPAWLFEHSLIERAA